LQVVVDLYFFDTFISIEEGGQQRDNTFLINPLEAIINEVLDVLALNLILFKVNVDQEFLANVARFLVT
jgi:hypothetical protein